MWVSRRNILDVSATPSGIMREWYVCMHKKAVPVNLLSFLYKRLRGVVNFENFVLLLSLFYILIIFYDLLNDGLRSSMVERPVRSVSEHES
jgi:quinol-cytochrome oxidoreductase complex cytochrome b subunit